MTDHRPKITFGEMRSSGVRDVLVYCRDHHCSHHIRISADFWPDHLRLSDIETKLHLYTLRQARRGRAAEVLAGQHGDGLVQPSQREWPESVTLRC